MRDTFAKEMTSHAQTDSSVVLLSGDIGNKMFDEFKAVAPDRFWNCGIAEANMMSMASGLALCGMKPVVYTITPFVTARCFEQIKISVAYHNAPVTIVGTGSGLSYAELGPTHHSLDDIGLLRTIPGLNILAPCDSVELKACLSEALQANSPSYIRIGKKGEPNLTESNSSSSGISRSTILKDGDDLLVIGIGPILKEVLDAAEEASSRGVSVCVLSLCSVKPLDEEYLMRLSSRYKRWLVVEEHSVIGGVGSAILEWLNDKDLSDVRLKRLAAPDKFVHELGKQHYMRSKMGLDKTSLVSSMLNIFQR